MPPLIPSAPNSLVPLAAVIGVLGGIKMLVDFWIRDKRQEQRRRNYREDYLKSDNWKRKRALVLKRDGHKCVLCHSRATQVHHKRYAPQNIGREPIEWLVAVCDACHRKQHNSSKSSPTTRTREMTTAQIIEIKELCRTVRTADSDFRFLGFHQNRVTGYPSRIRKKLTGSRRRVCALRTADFRTGCLARSRTIDASCPKTFHLRPAARHAEPLPAFLSKSEKAVVSGELEGDVGCGRCPRRKRVSPSTGRIKSQEKAEILQESSSGDTEG